MSIMSRRPNSSGGIIANQTALLSMAILASLPIDLTRLANAR